MNEQTIILFFLVFFTINTLFLYIWKSNREVTYKGDERWQFIQNKANNMANSINYILALFLAMGEALVIFFDIQLTLTINRVLIYSILFIGFRNTIELFALKYFHKRI